MSKGVVLVTGAGQGIGRAIALRLADDGFDVAVNDTSVDNLAEVWNQLASKQCKRSMHVADVSIDEQVRTMVHGVVREHGSLDVMVANAGIVRLKSLLETTEDDWDRQFAVNAKGTFFCYKYAGAQMIAQGRGGRIIGASSVAGKRGTAYMGAYVGSKFAIRGLTQTAAIEFGPHGITVNAYAPGAIETSLLQQMDEQYAMIEDGKPGDMIKSLGQRTPLGCTGSPEDIAGLVSYFASKDSRFITGQSFWQRLAHWLVYWLTMAGFLRKKVKQDSQSKPSSAQSPPPSSPTAVPPLFARFASATHPAKEAPRIVSSPMLLSSARRDAAAPLHNHNRGNRNPAQTAVQSQRDAETRGPLHQSHNAGRGRDMPIEQGNRALGSRQHSPTQVRARPVSRVPMLDKPLPPSFASNPFAPSAPTPTHPRASPPSPEHASPIQGEYAHLWSIIAGDDKPLPESVEPEPPSMDTIPVPEKADVHYTSRSTHAPSSTISPPDLVTPLPRPAPHGDSNPLPRPPSGAQKPTPPIASSFDHALIFDKPNHDFRAQALTPRPSNRSLSRQASFAEEIVSRLDSGASTSRTTLSSDDIQYDGLAFNVFGTQPMKSSHEPLSSNRQSRVTPDFSYNQDSDPHSLPSPSTSPKSNRKLSKTKPPGQPSSTSPPSQLSAAFEEKRTNFAQLQPSHDEHQESRHRPDMGVNYSTPDVFASQQSIKGISSQDILANNQRRTISPPPQAHTSPQQRTSVSYTPMTPPRKSSSMRSTNGPVVTGKPLIFSAMASIDQARSSAPPRPLPAAQPVGQNQTWSNSAPPLQQQHPSTPTEFPVPTRKESLNRFPQHGQVGRQPAAINDSFNHVGAAVFPQGPPHSPPSKDVHPSLLNGNRPPVPAVEQSMAPRQSPSRTRRPSKARTPAQSSTDPSSQPNPSTNNGPSQRPPSAKVRPTTPISPGRPGPIQIDGDVLGVPLDDDPFAKVDGVKMLKPVSRPPSPAGTEGTGRRLKSRDGRREGGVEEVLSDAGSHGEPSRPGSHPSANDGTPPSPVSQERMLVDGQGGEREPQSVTPPVINGLDGAQDYLTGFVADIQLLATLLGFLSFYDWCMILSLSRDIRFMVVQNPLLREVVLERFLKTVGYARWAWNEPDPISLSLQDLNDYMRGVSTPTHEYARVAALYVHSLSIHPAHRDQSLYETVRHLSASTRAYSRVVIRLRAQAEKEAAVARFRGPIRGGSRPPSRAPSPTFSHSNHSNTSAQTQPPPTVRPAAASFQSPLFRLKRAPLLRAFVPSPDGDWLSDKSVLECEGECRRAGVTGLMRVGDVVWDVAVGDEGNVGRLVWDGSYLIDLDYTYSPIGDLPKYMPTLAFPPSYFHRVIRTGPNSSNPIVHIDLQPWGEEIAANLQLLQDRVRTETPQGAYHNVVRWVHRSSFVIRPLVRGASRSPNQYTHNRTAPPAPSGRIPIPDSNMFVDPGWYGTIVVETEGTNESLADLQDRCGPGAFPPRPPRMNGAKTSAIERESKLVFRILRERSRPGEIWIRTVSPKERLL